MIARLRSLAGLAPSRHRTGASVLPLREPLREDGDTAAVAIGAGGAGAGSDGSDLSKASQSKAISAVVDEESGLNRRAHAASPTNMDAALSMAEEAAFLQGALNLFRSALIDDTGHRAIGQ